MKKVTKIILTVLSIYSFIGIVLYGLLVFFDYRTIKPEPMIFPNISEITHIEIIGPKNPEDASSYYLYSIKNKQQIEEIINFLEKHNNNWGYSFGPLPVYPYTASFKNNEKYLISIFFGIENSIGSSEDIATIISSEEEQELLRLLEVSQY